MRCYQCRRELGRNAHWLRYSRQPFCKEHAGQRESGVDSDYRVFVNGLPVSLVEVNGMKWFFYNLPPKEVEG